MFNVEQQVQLFDALRNAAEEFHYDLTDASVESWHLHWIVHHGFDSVPTMVGRLKNRMRQALGIGRIWTEGYYDSRLFDMPAIENRRRYIGRHAGCRTSNAILIARKQSRKVNIIPSVSPPLGSTVFDPELRPKGAHRSPWGVLRGSVRCDCCKNLPPTDTPRIPRRVGGKEKPRGSGMRIGFWRWLAIGRWRLTGCHFRII